MAVISLDYVNGLHEGFANVSQVGDALYFRYKDRPPFIVFDDSLRGFPAAQEFLKIYLTQLVMKNGFKLCFATLSDFGLCLEDTDLDLMLFSLSVFRADDFGWSNTG
jgi:hypothetical protein